VKLYDSLQLTPDATEQQIQESFDRLSKYYDPAITGKTDIDETFHEISIAY